MKKILYVTGSRAEYGIMKRLLKSLEQNPVVDFHLVVTGMHCDTKYGYTYKIIENDGFIIDELIDININNHTNADVLKSMATCQTKFADYFQNNNFDAVILLGDRYEIFSVAIAAAMNKIPIIHFHGGEKTLGNYDEFIRHSITKMSQLHLASTEEYRKRIIQMGEHPDTVFNIGALGAENALTMNLPKKYELEDKFGSLERPYFMVVFHPETLTNTLPSEQIEELLEALETLNSQYDFIFIGSNSDTGSDEIVKKIDEFCCKNKSRYFTSVRPEEYLALCKFSNGLIGNSSSGLIEIPSLKIATINIGDRQKGRVRGNTVIDCKCDKNEIYNSITLSQSLDFQRTIKSAVNPYYQNEVLQSAIDIIITYLDNPEHENKNFYDL